MKNQPQEELTKLLNLIALGDNKAVEVVFRHYQAALYAFIRLRVRDDSAAEEILNDTFMIAFQKTTQYDGTAEFKTWLCGIAKNFCGTWIRKQNTGLTRSNIMQQYIAQHPEAHKTLKFTERLGRIVRETGAHCGDDCR